jgi:sorbitol-specific phosphotransferase system component IIC
MPLVLRRAFIRLVISLAVISLFVNAAVADLTFERWAKGPRDGKAIYVAGVLDTIGVFAEILGNVDAFKRCLEEKKISYGTFGEAAVSFVSSRPELWSQPAPAVLVMYLSSLCGFNAAQKPTQ